MDLLRLLATINNNNVFIRDLSQRVEFDKTM